MPTGRVYLEAPARRSSRIGCPFCIEVLIAYVVLFLVAGTPATRFVIARVRPSVPKTVTGSAAGLDYLDVTGVRDAVVCVKLKHAVESIAPPAL